jgi:hypothetical protein
MPNILINPSSGILEFNTGIAGGSSFSSLSGASRFTFNSGEINLASYATGVKDRFTIDGSAGRLFSVSDALTGTIFSVNDIAGLPLIEVVSTSGDTITMGPYNTSTFVIKDTKVGIGTGNPSYILDVNGSAKILSIYADGDNGTRMGAIAEGFVTNRTLSVGTVTSGPNYANCQAVIIGTTSTRHALVVQGLDSTYTANLLRFRVGTNVVGFINSGANFFAMGGTGNTSAAIKSSGISIQARLADDSDFADFQAKNITANSSGIFGSGFFRSGLSASGTSTFYNQLNVSGIKYDVLTGTQIPPAYQEGFSWYDDDNKALSYYNDVNGVPVHMGQQQLVRGTNNLPFTLTKGQVVYITGAGGGDKFPGFSLALATGDNTSARTIGVIANDITSNGKGYAISFGKLEGIDTSAYNVGDTLYLSWTSSGSFTGAKPQAPYHMVRVGTVLRQGNSSNGVIFVTIQNGYELEELHDVRITNPQNNQAILWNSTSGVWANEQISTGDINGINNLVTVSGNQTIYGNKTFAADLNASSLIIEPGNLRIFDSVLSGDVFNLTEGSNCIVNGIGCQIDLYSQVISGFEIYSQNIYQNGSLVITSNDTGDFLSVYSNVVYTTGNQTINGIKNFTNSVGINNISPSYTFDVNGSGNFTSGILTSGNFESSTASNGIILKSPNGSRYKITVNNDGSLSTTLI